MDNKTVFVLTLKGEGEIKNHTHQLSDDIKRVLVLVDDESTVEILAKRVAPSLRASLDDMLQKLENGGFVQDKANARTGNMLRMSTPKMSVQTKHVAEGHMEKAEDLDFTSNINARAQTDEIGERAKAEVAQAKVEAEIRAHIEMQARAKQEADAARLKAEQEAAQVLAEAVRIKAEQDAAKARTELEAARLEAARVRAELEAAKMEAEAIAKREAEATRRKIEEKIAKAKAEAEVAKAKAEAEATRLKAVQDAAQATVELEAALAKAAAEAQTRAKARASVRAEAEAKARQEVDTAQLGAEHEIARIKAETEAQVRQTSQADSESTLAAKAKADASAARSMIATVLFFDVVGYTKQSVSKQIELKEQFNKLVSEFIKDIEENQRIILDTGDGAALGFLQHPEDAIEVALKFRQAVTANKHQNYPELMVRMGIHLGPVNIVKDMNGQSNMVGDGINDAQRIMSFASFDQIYISRSYYDIISRLSAEYAKLFQYRGVKNDKHGRQHQVYEATVDASEGIKQDAKTPESIDQTGIPQESAPFSIDLEAFILNGLEQTATTAPTQLPNVASEEIPDQIEQADVLQKQAEIVQHDQFTPEKIAPKTQQEIEAEAQALAEQKALQEAEAARNKAAQEAAKAKMEKDAHQMADEQAKTWAEAEQRAKAQAVTQTQVEHETQQPGKTPQVKTSPPIAHARRKPLPLGKIATSLFLLLLALIVALPYVWPMQDYVAQLETKLSAQLQQPVHIAQIKVALLPLPKLELQDVSVGDTQKLKATSVVLNFDVTAFFANIRTIKTMEINDLALNADSFGEVLGWLQAAGGDPHYPVERMVLERARISGEGLNLPSINGTADWNAQGYFSKALLRSEDGKLEVELQPQQSRWQIALHIKESSLPWFPGILFNELNANGEAGEGMADFTGIDGQLYGGELTGSAHLHWQTGWQMQGHLNIKAIELQKALPQSNIEGEMDGDSNFQLNSATLPRLANAPYLDGTFTVKKGVINKIDMVQTATNQQGMSGGRTHFDELSGTLQIENNSQHLRQLKISSGVMSALGSVDVSPGGQLSGRLSVDLKMRAGSAPLVLSGTLAEPLLRPAR